MAAIDTIYNYYLSTYGNSTVNRYDTHKKSELRSVYNNMIKVNKEAPLYKILGSGSGDVTRLAIDIKEISMNLSKVAASLSDDTNVFHGAFKKKVAASSDPDTVGVTYVGNESNQDELNSSFTLEVKQLADHQINIGNFLQPEGKDIPEGQYSFDFENTVSAYEFQFGVSKDDTNYSIQQKLAKLINTANVGADAMVEADDDGLTSLIIKSKETGLSQTEEYLFKISPSMDFLSKSAMSTLGIDFVAKPAQNSSFLLNGSEHTSLSNTFTINKEFEVTLKGISPEDTPAQIGFENDLDSIAENVSTLVDSYNQSISTAMSHMDSTQHSTKLLHDITAISFAYKDELEATGLMVRQDGSIEIDRSVFDDALSNDNESVAFERLNTFKNAVAARASQIAINPMNYVNKVVVAYKNPGRGFSAPYSTSMYAGMMLDRYC